MHDLLYHYTAARTLRDIDADGVLRPSSEGASDGERPAVWFTFRPTYDPIAVKMVGPPPRLLTLHEQRVRFGLARVGVSPSVAPLTWTDWAREAGVSGRERKWMERTAKARKSDVRLYRATFEPVPARDWVVVEVEGPDGWVPYVAPKRRRATRPSASPDV